MTNEQKNLMLEQGFTEKELTRFEAQVQYRKSYAKRPEVVSARKDYNKKRSDRMKELKEVLKGL